MKSVIKNLKLDLTESTITCKGLVFKGKVTQYLTNTKGNFEIVRKEKVRLSKRLSCKGCDHCGWLLDSINELSENVILPNIEHNELYSVHTINESRDWETGIVDDYDVEFFKIEKSDYEPRT